MKKGLIILIIGIAVLIFALILLNISSKNNFIESKNPSGQVTRIYYPCPGDCKGPSSCSLAVGYSYCLWNYQTQLKSSETTANNFFSDKEKECSFTCGSWDGMTLQTKEKVQIMENAIKEKNPINCEELPPNEYFINDSEKGLIKVDKYNRKSDVIYYVYNPYMPEILTKATNSSFEIKMGYFGGTKKVHYVGPNSNPLRDHCYYLYSMIHDDSFCDKIDDLRIKNICLTEVKDDFENKWIAKAVS